MIKHEGKDSPTVNAVSKPEEIAQRFKQEEHVRGVERIIQHFVGLQTKAMFLYFILLSHFEGSAVSYFHH